jgi:hypothetical protein
MTRALLGEDLRGTLEEQTVATGTKANHDSHGFPFAGKGDHLNDLADSRVCFQLSQSGSLAN